MKTFFDKRNIVGNLLIKYRKLRGLNKKQISEKLDLLGVSLDRFELYKIESGKASVKDFELVALCLVLDIDFFELKDIIENGDN